VYILDQYLFSLLVLPAYPIGQLGMRGLAIHLPMQIPELVNKLPRDGQNANIAVIYSAATCKPKIVRVKKVFEALEWLKLHNYLYKDLNISNLLVS
jgi:hypothetical protein